MKSLGRKMHKDRERREAAANETTKVNIGRNRELVGEDRKEERGFGTKLTAKKPERDRPAGKRTREDDGAKPPGSRNRTKTNTPSYVELLQETTKTSPQELSTDGCGARGNG